MVAFAATGEDKVDASMVTPQTNKKRLEPLLIDSQLGAGNGARPQKEISALHLVQLCNNIKRLIARKVNTSTTLTISKLPLLIEDSKHSTLCRDNPMDRQRWVL